MSSSDNYIKGEQCKWCKVKGLYSKVAKSSGKTHFYWSGDDKYHDFNECKEIQGKIKECGNSLDEKMGVWLSYINKHSLSPPPDYEPSNESSDPDRELVANRKKELYQKSKGITFTKEKPKEFTTKDYEENNINEEDILKIEENAFQRAIGKVLLEIDKKLRKLNEIEKTVNDIKEVVIKNNTILANSVVNIDKIIENSISFPNAKQLAEKKELSPLKAEEKTIDPKSIIKTTVPIVDEGKEIARTVIDENNEELDLVNEVYDAVDTSAAASTNELDYDESVEEIPISK